MNVFFNPAKGCNFAAIVAVLPVFAVLSLVVAISAVIMMLTAPTAFAKGKKSATVESIKTETEAQTQAQTEAEAIKVYKSSDVISLMSRKVLDLNQKPITGVLETNLVDGNIMRSTYADGRREGVERIYDTDGVPSIEYSYRRGKLNGYFREFYPNGVVKKEVEIIYDKRHGAEREYYRDGKLRSLRIFNNGMLSGKVAQYSDEFEDKLLQEGEVIDDKFQGAIYAYYPSGSLKSSYSYADDMLNGEARLYKEDSILEATLNYKDAQLHGDYTTYYQSGNIESVATYRRGVLSSEIIIYTESGVLKEGKISNKVNGAENNFSGGMQPQEESTILELKYTGDEI